MLHQRREHGNNNKKRHLEGREGEEWGEDDIADGP